MLITAFILMCGYESIGFVDQDCRVTPLPETFYTLKDCREEIEQRKKTLEFHKRMNKNVRGMNIVGGRCIMWRELGEKL